MRQVFGGNALAVVGDLDPHHITGPLRAEFDSARPTVPADRVAGLEQQVHEELIQLTRRAFDLGQMVEAADDLDTLVQLIPQELQRLLDALDDHRPPELRAVELGEVLQVLQDR